MEANNSEDFFVMAAKEEQLVRRIALVKALVRQFVLGRGSCSTYVCLDE